MPLETNWRVERFKLDFEGLTCVQTDVEMPVEAHPFAVTKSGRDVELHVLRPHDGDQRLGKRRFIVARASDVIRLLDGESVHPTGGSVVTDVGASGTPTSRLYVFEVHWSDPDCQEGMVSHRLRPDIVRPAKDARKATENQAAASAGAPIDHTGGKEVVG